MQPTVPRRAVWPPHYFVIGSEAEQNWNFLDLSRGGEAVFQFHHDEGEVRETAASVREFPDELVAWWREIERLG